MEIEEQELTPEEQVSEYQISVTEAKHQKEAVESTVKLRLKASKPSAENGWMPTVTSERSKLMTDISSFELTIPAPSKKQLAKMSDKEAKYAIAEWKRANKELWDARLRWVRRHVIFIQSEQHKCFVIFDWNSTGQKVVKLVSNVNTRETAGSHQPEIRGNLSNASGHFHTKSDPLLALLGVAERHSLRIVGEPVLAMWENPKDIVRLKDNKVFINTFTKEHLPWYNMVSNALENPANAIDDDKHPINQWEEGEQEFNNALDNVFLQTTKHSAEVFEGLFEWNLAYPFALDTALVVLLGLNATGKSSLTKLYAQAICGAKCNLNTLKLHAKFTEREHPVAFGDVRDDMSEIETKHWDMFKSRRTLQIIKEEQKYEPIKACQNTGLEIWTANWRNVKDLPPGTERRFILISLEDPTEFQENFLPACNSIGNVLMPPTGEEGYTPIASRWIRRRLTRAIIARGEPFDIKKLATQSWHASSCAYTKDKLIADVNSRHTGKDSKLRNLRDDMEIAVYSWNNMEESKQEAILRRIKENDIHVGYPCISSPKQIPGGDYIGMLRVSPVLVSKVLSALGVDCNWQTFVQPIRDWGKTKDIERVNKGQKRFYPYPFNTEWPIEEVSEIIHYAFDKITSAVNTSEATE